MMPVFSLLKSHRRLTVIAMIIILCGLVGIWVITQNSVVSPVSKVDAPTTESAERPALTVTLTTPQLIEWPRIVVANGNIAAWQEIMIGTEISGYRLSDVLVNVGDTVKKGQILARISSDIMVAELAQTKATIVEAEAILAEARLNADRARKVESAGALSAQQINQYITAEQTALARVSALKAKWQADTLRLAQTRIIAPDDGVITARMATIGALAQSGQELFRLIRNNRLEWRAEVTATELAYIKAAMKVSLVLPDGTRAKGTVRTIAPTVDIQTRNAIIYVDLKGHSTARAGMFVRGEFELGIDAALTLPQSAVLIRDGFNYIYQIDDSHHAMQTKVTLGQRRGDRVEVTRGLSAMTRVVASGVGFLADGDMVRVVDATALPASTPLPK